MKFVTQILFSESGDGQEHPFGVSFIAENYIHHLRDLSCLIRRAVDIKDWDVM